MNQPLLRLRDIGKSFFGNPVLQNISFEMQAGQTIGLVGENGAGKSTLMNILGGVLAPDSGDMELFGNTYCPESPRASARAGIAFIHQELNLFPNLSVAENLFLSHFPKKLAWIDRSELYKRSRELLARVGLDISPGTKVQSLSAGQRQLVEIAKALGEEARLIILDEPTTSLTDHEVRKLFRLLRELQSQQVSMIYISHALGDVKELCDRILVLRDGQVVADEMAADLQIPDMIRLMVGRQLDRLFPESKSQPGESIVLEANRISQPGVVHEISFQLRAGEVLGLAGLMGSGRTELARILFGLEPMTEGELRLLGEPVQRLSVSQRITKGMAMLTESRRVDGLCTQDSALANLTMVVAKKFTSRLGWIRRRSLHSSASQMAEAVRLNLAEGMNQAVCTLSGGNQQKVVLGKWLLNKPKLLILDEPTRGIDVGAKFEIYALIDQLACEGAGILVISSEIDELMGICDRILVMSQGELKDELQSREFNRERILKSALHADAIWEGDV